MNLIKKEEVHIPFGLEGVFCNELLTEFANVLLIVDNLESVDQVFQNSRFFLSPEHEVLKFPSLSFGCYRYGYPKNLIERAYALSRLVTSSAKKLVVTDLKALFEYQIPKNFLVQQSIVLEYKQKIQFTSLVRSLVNLGYQRVSVAEEHGEFAVRGGIIDIVLYDGAVRLSFTADIITQIKSYDVVTQISSKVLNTALIHAVNEHYVGTDLNKFIEIFTHKFPNNDLSETNSYEVLQQQLPLHHYKKMLYQESCSIFDYLTPKTIILNSEHLPVQILKIWQDIENKYIRAKESARTNDLLFNYLPPREEFHQPNEILAMLGEFEQKRCLEFANKNKLMNAVKPSIYQKSQLEQKSIYSLLNDFLQDMQQQQKVVVIALSELGQLKKLNNFLTAQNIHFKVIKNFFELQKYQKALTILPLKDSFQNSHYIFLAESDIFGKHSKISKPSKKFNMQKFMQETKVLRHGELIVHKDFGIGMYSGLEEIDFGGKKRDYVKLIYLNNEKYYLPVEFFDLISKYGGSEGVPLDKLGRLSWANRKKKAKAKIKIIAEKLMQIAAKRKLAKGVIINFNSNIYNKFCQKFPYVETEDQLSAIHAVQEDLSSGQIMDRLICGDVGFGKTEVALRAVCMAVAGNNPVQVAIIAPTTLLVDQHFKTVQERFAGFNVKIGAMSRLQTPKEMRDIKMQLKNGEIDIIIATHAILAKDVKILNLGLLIIDEEQHFGVKQKEKLKKLQPNVHILTLSATPIPRTLQMSLVGIKDLSLLTTPPVDRLPIKSEVVPFSNNIIKEAIVRELTRKGVVFVVTPRIKNIEKLSKLLHKILPTARIKEIHGKLTVEEVSVVISQLRLGQLDVLISTQIIESGVDIENANTLIVHDADMFGLSQLYQIRGRVGRRKRQAFAYLSYNKNKILSANAKERLQVMQSLDTLGSSFDLAASDMDTRGYGNLVGEEQSGNIKEIGVELYQKMLQDAIHALERQQEHKSLQPLLLDDVTIKINLPIKGQIPKNLVADENLRCNLYRRIIASSDFKQVEAIKNEINDRFGSLPQQLQNLFHIVNIKSLAKNANVSKIEAVGRVIKLSFYQRKIFNPGDLIDYLQKIMPKYEVIIQG